MRGPQTRICRVTSTTTLVLCRVCPWSPRPDLDATPEKQRYKIGHAVLEVFHLVKVHLAMGAAVISSSDEEVDDDLNDAEDIEEVQ